MNKSIMTVALATASTLALAACSVPSGDSKGATGSVTNPPKSLVMTNTGGDWGLCQRKSFFTPFTAKTGIKVVDGQFQNDGQIIAMSKAKQYSIDVVYPSSNLAIGDAGKAALEPIDYSKIAKDQLAPGTFTDYAVSIDLYSWVLGYRIDKVGGQPPTSWADFYDLKKFPGKRALPGDIDAPAILFSALLADGVKPDALLPLDVPRALKKLSTIKNNIVWYSSGSQGQELLKSGEVSLGMEYANRVASLRDGGTPAAIVWNGQIVAGDLVGVAKGNPNASTAMDLIASITSKEVNGTFSYCAAGSPSNTQSKANPKIAADLATSHLDLPHVTENSPALATYLAKNRTDVMTAFNNWRAS